MKIKWSRLWARIRKISLPDWRVLFLLVTGAFLQGMGFVYLDVGTIALFLQNHGIFHVGFDFLCLAALLSFVGTRTVKLDRRYGYGGAPLTAFLILILIVLLMLINQYGPTSILIQTLFVYRYVAMVLISTAFWTIAHRFIVFKFNSFKFLGVLASEFLGFTVGGILLAHPNGHPLAHLNGAVGWFIGLFLVLKILVWLLPMPSETLIRKSGGVQDLSENKMIICILWMSFLYTSARFLSDYFLYHTLLQKNVDVGEMLSYLWSCQGGVGFIFLILYFRLPYMYLQILGLWGILLAYASVCAGILWNNLFFMCVGMVVLGVCGRLSWSPFLSMLPKLLTLGQGRRLRWRRQVVIQPLAVLFSGALIITVPLLEQSFVLLGTALFLGCSILIGISFYSRFLLHMCQMRRWCSGPLMLISKQVVRYVQEGVLLPEVNDAIYFLRLMQQADYSKYAKFLIQSLNHPQPMVRLFVLDKLDILGINASLARLLQQKMAKEKNDDVCCRILAMLIRYHSEQSSRTIFHKYGAYLDDKKLRAGAVLGFLQAGGDSALLAMDGLQKMAQSSDKKQNLKALEIMDYIPQTGFIRLVLPLLKSHDEDVKRHALLTAGRIGHVQALGFVLSALDDPLYQESAVSALKMYGKRALPPIEKMVTNPSVPLARRKKLILFLMLSDGGEGKEILLRNLCLGEQKLRKDIFKSILDSKIIWISWRRRQILKRSILQDVERWHWLKENIQKCRQAPDTRLSDAFAFLSRSFEDSCRDTRLIILYQLMLLYPESLTERAVEILLSDAVQYRESTISLLQDLLPNFLKEKIIPVLLDQPNTEQPYLNLFQAKSFLSQLITYPDFPVDRWVQSCALSGLKFVGDIDLLPILKAAFETPWPVVWEAALDVLNVWIDDPKRKKDILKDQVKEFSNLALKAYLKKKESV